MLLYFFEVTQCENHVLRQNLNQLDDLEPVFIRETSLACDVDVPVVSVLHENVDYHWIVRISNHRLAEP